jgi:hypothetical protein
MANKISRGTRTECSTFGTDLGCVVRFNSNNFNAFSFSFVLDKTLKLIKAPVANPIVHSLSSSLFPYAFEVFHDYFVSVEIGNNVFTDVVVIPSHEPLLFSTQLLEKPSGTSSAFGLKFTTQVFELPFDLLDFSRIIKLAVGSDCQVIYSEVDAKNSILDIRAFGSNLFRECEQKETSILFIHPEKALSDIPSEIFFVTIRDSKWYFNSAFDCSQRQDIVLEGCRTREVVSHRASIYDWFGFSLLDHSTGLLDTSNSELALQSITFKRRIDKWMELDIIPYLVLPCSINAELQSFSVYFECINYLSCCSNLDFSCCPDVHNGCKEQPIYKTIGGNARNDGTTQFLPSLKALGILATII